MNGKELVTTQKNQVDHFDTAMLEGVHQFATKLSNSALIPAALRGKPADITIVLLTGKEVGLSPMMALQTIDVIKGRQVIEGTALLALIRSNVANPYIKLEQAEDGEKATCTMARSKSEEDMEESFTSVWDMTRAATAGLTHKDNWKHHKSEMLQWRAVSECARIIFPDISMGLYLRDEVEHLAEATVSDGLTESDTNAELEAVEPIDVTSIETVADELVDSVKKPSNGNDEIIKMTGKVLDEKINEIADKIAGTAPKALASNEYDEEAVKKAQLKVEEEKLKKQADAKKAAEIKLEKVYLLCVENLCKTCVKDVVKKGFKSSKLIKTNRVKIKTIFNTCICINNAHKI